MAERFPYGQRYYYPHMKPNDVAIWERFIAANPAAFDECEYDVQVGYAPPFDPTVNDATGGDASALYKKKIDVVAFKAGQPFIIEVKPNAGHSAVGQLLGYVELYKQDYLPAAEPKAIILTDSPAPDTKLLADKYGIKILTA